MNGYYKQRNIKKKILILFTCVSIAFFFSVSFLVHFLDWYMRSLFMKILSLTILTSLLSLLFYFIQERSRKKCKIHPQLPRYLLFCSLIVIFILVFYFAVFYQSTPFPTEHKLQITNVSGTYADEKWSPVEIINLTFQDRVPISIDDLEFHDEHWISGKGILLKPSSSISFKRSFIGGVQIYFRSDNEQGKVLILWDDHEQIIDLSVGNEPLEIVLLPASSWGIPTLPWRVVAILSAVSDFFSILFGILLLIAILLENYLSEKENREINESSLKFGKIDILIIATFLVFSLILSKNLFGGHFMDYTLLLTDAGNYASFAAAQKYPELFRSDPFLGNIDNFNMFSSFHVYLTKALESIFGNFGTAFMILQLPLTFLQLCGFYLLGKELYRNRLFGFLLSILAFVFVKMNLSEFWGYETSPIPRFSFQACIPFVLLLVLKQGQNPRKWPLILSITALLTYVHAVSTPAWSIAIILSLWFMTPRSISARVKGKYLLFSLFLFFVILLPFSLQYFHSTLSADQSMSARAEIQAIMSFRLPEGQIDFNVAMHDFLNVLLQDISHQILFFTSIISFMIMNLIPRNSPKGRRVMAASMWVIGIYIGSIVFTMFDYGIAALLGRNPLQIQFIRSLRNFFPLLYIFFLWPFALSYRKIVRYKLNTKIISLIPVLICAIFIFEWGKVNEFEKTPVMASTLTCWREGKIVCSENKWLGTRAEFYTELQELTPENSRILGDDLAIRYFSLRPMAFSTKDGGAFSVTNHSALLDWYEYLQVYDEITSLKDDWHAYIDEYTDFAHRVHADYLIIEDAYSSQDYYPAELKLVFSNDEYTLLEIQNSIE